MKLFKRYFALAGCLLTLASCGTKNLNDLEQNFKHDVKNVNANIFLKSFSDHRQGQDLLLPKGSNIVYAYKPQSLTNGQMLPLLGYYLYHTLDTQDKSAKNSLGVDVSIRKVNTVIRHGNITKGRLGYYSAELEARVILRDMAKNEIIETFPIMVSDNKNRVISDGRQPSIYEDKYALLNLVDSLALKLADEVLDEVADIANDYYRPVATTYTIPFNRKAKTEVKETLEKANTVKVEEIKEDEFKVTPEMLDYIQTEEQKLLERKEKQREMFENKLEEQKHLDFLDNAQ